MLRHLQLAADPPPMAQARAHQATFDWVASAHDVARGLVGDVRAAEVCDTPLNVCNPVCNLPLQHRPSHRPFQGLRPRAPLRRYPTPSSAACPGRAPPCSGALRRVCPRRGIYLERTDNFTFHRISWWPNGPQMVKAAHTVIPCFSMTFEQRRKSEHRMRCGHAWYRIPARQVKTLVLLRFRGWTASSSLATAHKIGPVKRNL